MVIGFAIIMGFLVIALLRTVCLCTTSLPYPRENPPDALFFQPKLPHRAHFFGTSEKRRDFAQTVDLHVTGIGLDRRRVVNRTWQKGRSDFKYRSRNFRGNGRLLLFQIGAFQDMQGR